MWSKTNLPAGARLTPHLLIACLALTACGGSEGDPKEARIDAPARAVENAADAREAWLLSDERPVNRACNPPGYTPGQPDTFIGLHAPLYPVVEARGEELKAKARTLNPQIGDEDMHDVDAYETVGNAINALAQWHFVMGVDAMPLGVARMCDVPAYDEDECSATRRLTRSVAEYTDFTRTEDGLNYSLGQEDGVSKIFLSNADADTVRFSRTGTEGTFSGEWTRAADGTERLSAGGPDAQYTYTERPDCSGTAKVTRRDDYGNPASWAWAWTSVTSGNFGMTYTRCTFNRVTEEEDCFGGSL